MAVFIVCCIAVVSTSAFLAIWFIDVYQELSRIRKEIMTAAEQVQMHRMLYMQEHESTNAQAAKKMLDTSGMIYREIVKEYNYCFHNPVYHVPGFVMGFRRISDVKLQ